MTSMRYDMKDPNRKRATDEQPPDVNAQAAEILRRGLRRAVRAGHWPPKDTDSRSVENRLPNTADDTTTEVR